MSMFVEFFNQPENFLDKWRNKIINEVTMEGSLLSPESLKCLEWNEAGAKVDSQYA